MLGSNDHGQCGRSTLNASSITCISKTSVIPERESFCALEKFNLIRGTAPFEVLSACGRLIISLHDICQTFVRHGDKYLISFLNSLPTIVDVEGGIKIEGVYCGASHTLIVAESGHLYSVGSHVSLLNSQNNGRVFLSFVLFPVTSSQFQFHGFCIVQLYPSGAVPVFAASKDRKSTGRPAGVPAFT